MARFTIAALFTAFSVTGLAGLALAEPPTAEPQSLPVIAQLQLRDRTVTVKSHSDGYLYSIADESGTVLSAAITEQEIAEQYPELFDRLQPAIADNENTELMMLAPMVQ
ncbi:MAG: hypothetical protein ACFB14_10895 [Leptolyngbyaceae cyanobacterium]